MGAIAQGISYLLSLVADAVAWIGRLFVAVFAALWDLLADAFAWVVDQLLDLVVSAIASLADSQTVADLIAAAPALGDVPSQMVDVLHALGLGTCFSIISAALAIRFVLGLIPFVRVGG